MDKVFLQYVFLHVSPNHHNLKKILYAIHMLQLYVFSGVSSNYSLLKKILYTDCMYTVFRRYVFSGVGLKFHLLKKILNTDYIGMVKCKVKFPLSEKDFIHWLEGYSFSLVCVLMLLQILYSWKINFNIISLIRFFSIMYSYMFFQIVTFWKYFLHWLHW